MAQKRVLIVDDEPGIREIMEIIITSMTPWEVLMATSGREAIAIASSQLPDAILLDMMMPDLDGIDTLTEIQANDATKSIPTIFVTAKTINKTSQELGHLVVAGIINKPFKGSSLVEQIRSILQWYD